VTLVSDLPCVFDFVLVEADEAVEPSHRHAGRQLTSAHPVAHRGRRDLPFGGGFFDGEHHRHHTLFMGGL
jgi:hypothetical protein